MKKAAIVLIAYLLALFLFSLLFSWLGIKNFEVQISTIETLLKPMMIVTIIGGIISLYFTVSHRSFKIFLIAYCCLWALRYPINLAGEKIGEIVILNKHLRFDWFIFRYYDNITHICSPLAFLIFWFIDHFFIKTKATKENIKRKLI